MTNKCDVIPQKCAIQKAKSLHLTFNLENKGKINWPLIQLQARVN